MKLSKLKILINFLLLSFILSCSSDNNDNNNDNNLNLPQIVTNAAQNIGGSYATLGGTITDTGSSEINRIGVCWGTVPNPVLSQDNFVQDYGGELGNFSFDVNNLAPNTVYYFRAYCENSSGLQFGNSVSFTTSEIATTLNAKDILTTKATLRGYINQGNSDSTIAGFVYSTSQNPTINNTSIYTSITGSDNYEIQISDLTHNTIYYFRAYTAVYENNNYQYQYGEQKQIKTTGYTGSAGGHVAYDMGEDNEGWRYLEIHPISLYHSSTNGTGAAWGVSEFISGLSDQFGTGPQNTQIIANSVSSSNCAAKLCNNLTLNGYSDWFLPSKDEALLIANSLKSANISNYNSFWTSSQSGTHYAYFLQGSSSGQYQVTTMTKDYTGWVFPVRRY